MVFKCKLSKLYEDKRFASVDEVMMMHKCENIIIINYTQHDPRWQCKKIKIKNFTIEHPQHTLKEFFLQEFTAHKKIFNFRQLKFMSGV